MFVATAGAAATLTGLIFVGVSINLSKILSFRTLPTRALLSITLLFTILALSIIFLIPKQSIKALGVEVMIVAILAWVAVTLLDVFVLRRVETEYKRQQIFSTVLDQAAILPYLIDGILLLGSDEAGVRWMVPAFLFSFLKAILDAWVLLVEIHR